MALARVTAEQALAGLDSFDTLIDARSESEYALDHLPGALNWPTLDDAQRHAVGSEYKQVSAFDARKQGAVLAARNIARHIEREAMDKPRSWRPLVYCWRGGQRSGSFALVLEQIGFAVHLLDGGYRAYRRALRAALDALPPRFEWRVLCAPTGSGKSRLLHTLAAQGAQVIDLEALAEHRGSVLGLVPGEEQPGQKLFESRLWDALRRLDPARPVFVESESRKVGNLRVPESLIEAMRAARCVRLDMPLDARVQLLLEDYRYFVDDATAFCERLDALRTLRGHAVIEAWQASARAGRMAEVVRALLVEHYDPVYLASMERNFARFGEAPPLLLADGSAASLAAIAQRLQAAD